MRLKQIFKYYWVIMLTVLVLCFWLGFFISERVVNSNNPYYQIEICSTTIEIGDIDADFFLKGLAKYDENGNFELDSKGNVKYSYSSVKPQQFFANNDIEIVEKENKILITIKASYFVSKSESEVSLSSSERFIKVMTQVVNFHDEEATLINMKTKGVVNPILIGIFSVVGGFIVFLVVIIVLRNKLPIPNDDIYKSGNVYRFPISKEYWRNSINSVKKLKVFDMCMIAILFALQIVMKFVSIPSGFPGLNIVLNYLVFALISLIYGPIWGLIIGFSSDVIGFIMEPKTFHIGYTIQAMLTGFVYGLCFYKTELKFSRVLICRILVNIVLNGILGSFLMGDYYGWGFEGSLMYMIGVSLPKNIIYLIPQSILLFIFLRAAVVLPMKKGMIPKETLNMISKESPIKN